MFTYSLTPVYANCCAVEDLGLIGDEEVSIELSSLLDINQIVEVQLSGTGRFRSLESSLALYSSTELAIFKAGGIPGMILMNSFDAD